MPVFFLRLKSSLKVYIHTCICTHTYIYACVQVPAEAPMLVEQVFCELSDVGALHR